MTDFDIDLGSGFRAMWLPWSPDRSIPANAERFEGIPDVEKSMLLVKCPHGEGGIHVDTPEVRAVFPHGPHWTVESWEPLTLSPSILRTECGCHGFIREGKWVAAVTALAASTTKSDPLHGNVVSSSPLGLRLRTDLGFEEWCAIVQRLLEIEDRMQWWVGDALAQGEYAYGKKYRPFVDELELRFDRIKNWNWVAGNVPETVRRGDLTWTHHRAVAKLVPRDQERWLARAAAEGWSTRELLDALALELKPPDPTPAGVLLEQVRFTVDQERLRRWQTASTRVELSLTDWAIQTLDAAASL